MKPKFRLEDYKGNYVMHCTEKLEAEKFCNFLGNNGKKWIMDISYRTDCYFDTYTTNTCYEFNGGTFCNYDYFKNHNYIILNFNDFDWDKDKEMKIKQLKRLDGTIIYYKETDEGLVGVEEISNKRYIPILGDSWYYINVLNEVKESKTISSDDRHIQKCLNDNNCFKTSEEANRKKEIFDFIANKRKLFTMEDFKLGVEKKYSIYVDHNHKETFVDYVVCSSSNIYYFPSKEIAQEVADFVGYKDWLKYVLNIYEE